MYQKNLKNLCICMLLLSAFSCTKNADVSDSNQEFSDDISEQQLQSRTFISRAIFEDYTGAWCGYCPRIAYKFDLMEANNPRFFFVGNHNGDAFTTSWQSPLEKEFKINAFPTATKMRDWDANGKSIKFKDNGKVDNVSDTSQASDYLKTNDSLGLAITNAAISGNTITGKVKVGFGYTYTDSLKIVIELVETNLILKQSNYYNTSPVGNPFYGLGSYINDFEHHNVLRKVYTATFGDFIPSNSTKAGKQYSKSFSFDATGYNLSNCKIVAFVVGSKNNTKNKGIVNVQWANAGANKAFELVP